MKVLQREYYNEKHEHTGVWRKGYCYFRTDVASGESRNLRNPNPQGPQANSSLRATPAYGQPLRWLKPIHADSRAYDTGEATWILATAGMTEGVGLGWGGVDSGFRRNDGWGWPYSVSPSALPSPRLSPGTTSLPRFGCLSGSPAAQLRLPGESRGPRPWGVGGRRGFRLSPE